LSPNARIIVWCSTSSGEIITDSMEVNVDAAFANEVSSRFTTFKVNLYTLFTVPAHDITAQMCSLAAHVVTFHTSLCPLPSFVNVGIVFCCEYSANELYCFFPNHIKLCLMGLFCIHTWLRRVYSLLQSDFSRDLWLTDPFSFYNYIS